MEALEIYLAHLWALATKVSQKEEEIRVATLLAVIGEDAVRVYNTLQWEVPGDKRKITKLLDKPEAYCLPRKNIRFERYRFDQRTLASGGSIDGFVTTLRDLSIACGFDFERDSLICDRLVQGIGDDHVHERLLRETDLNLQKAVDIARSSEIAQVQAKKMAADEDIHSIKRKPRLKSASSLRDVSSSSSPSYWKDTTDARKWNKASNRMRIAIIVGGNIPEVRITAQPTDRPADVVARRATSRKNAMPRRSLRYTS